METRKVTIINSRIQSQKVIQDSKATTLGELKQEMRERNIDYTGMTFFEGHMRAELKDDAAPLPTNIPYKGQVVNDLVFMLTAPNKNIKSGAMSRAEAYAEIRKRGLQDACIDSFGKNFTQCSTVDLITLIERATSVPGTSAKMKEAPETPVTDCCTKALTILANALYECDYIEEETYDAVMTTLKGGSYNAPEEMSKREIDEMFDFVEK